MAKKDKKQEKTEEIFVIPQITSPFKGLKQTKEKFKPSPMASPILGTGLSDKVTYDDDSDSIGDYNLKYDAYRRNDKKKISNEELEKRFGTIYPGFEDAGEDFIKDHFDKDVKLNKKNLNGNDVKIEKPFFGIGEDSSKNKNDEIKESSDNVKNIDLEEKKETTFNFDDFEPVLNTEPEEPQKEEQPINEFRENRSVQGSTVIIRKPRNQYNEPINKEIKVEEYKIEENNTRSQQNTFVEREPQNEIKQETPQNSFSNNFNENNFANQFNNAETNLNNINEEIEDDITYEEPQELVIREIINPYKDYKLPPISLFAKSKEDNTQNYDELEENKEIINTTLASFDINGEVEHYVVGPTFTRFEITLEIGTNVKKIAGIQDTLQMNLGVKSIRIQAPIPGKKSVGIEVPNKVRTSVAFGDTLSEEFINDGKILNVAMGKDIDGNIIYTNIAKWPHGLIAGSTGSGKSVSINTIIVSILLKAKPDEVKFIMIDPKQVELSVYNDIPHLITPVISDPKMSSKALEWAVNEMERRFTLFTRVKARDITSYNERVSEDPTLQKIPYIVIIIDEMADLMIQCGQEVETYIQRIAQKARAAGIHLLCATQRPTVNVISGTIKSNIQARIAFKVNSAIDSTTILDEGGAEDLLGRGDMLLKEVDTASRVQGSFITDEEIDACVNFIHDEAEPHYLLSHEDLADVGETNGYGPQANVEEESPTLLYEISKWCCENQACSVNVIQRSFHISFNRAQAIISTLQKLGVVSERNGNKRDILLNLSQINDLFERNE